MKSKILTQPVKIIGDIAFYQEANDVVAIKGYDLAEKHIVGKEYIYAEIGTLTEDFEKRAISKIMQCVNDNV